MKHPGNISISDYTYDLPLEKIANHPLPERDASRLLIYSQQEIKEDTYSNIDKYLPSNSLLVFNNTRVINARLHFKKNTGALIEIFCLEPAEAVSEYAHIMARKEKVKWKCLVGGIAKWKDGSLEKCITHNGREVVLYATLIERINETCLIEFRWQPTDMSFAEILEIAGDTPLPPYIKRETAIEDVQRYQTIYAKHEGSVAAPTAGLHFTEAIFKKLDDKDISKNYVTLHVGAGTFKPVKAEQMQDHEMHAEWIDVDIDTIRSLALTAGEIIAVGTTSLRTLETLYWLGVKIIEEPEITDLYLGQWDIYNKEYNSVLPSIALTSLAAWLEGKGLKKLFTRTQLLIAPGYKFQIVKALITNFHQPQSTLLLLVAAAIGEDWRKLYNHALENEYRFLSYGDGNLIFINP